jgi:hypothetical protein
VIAVIALIMIWVIFSLARASRQQARRRAAFQSTQQGKTP